MRTKYNPFVVASPLEQHYLTRICEVAEICYERGWVWATSGNFSVHLRHGLVWQSPSGKCKGHLKPEDFLPVSLETAQVIRPESGLKASEEMPVHLGIFGEFSTAKCVVHAHPQELVAASEQDLEFNGQEMQKALGSYDYSQQLKIRVAPNQSRDTIAQFCKEDMKPYLHPEAGMVVFAKHGVYAWGHDPFDALKKIEAIEFLCKSTKNVRSVS